MSKTRHLVTGAAGFINSIADVLNTHTLVVFGI